MIGTKSMYLTPLGSRNYHTYPMVMEAGGIQELMYYNGKYFNKELTDVTHLVSFIWIYPRNRFTI